MTQKLVIASRNNHKIEEMRRILEQGGLDIELVGTAQGAGGQRIYGFTHGGR